MRPILYKNKWIHYEFCIELGKQASIFRPEEWDNFYSIDKEHALSGLKIGERICDVLKHAKDKK